MKKFDVLFCGDLHLRETTPISRIDDYSSAMWEKFKFINDLANEHNCPVLCSGDFYDKWKASPELLSKTIESITADWYSVFGDHDLPNHSLELKHKSGLTTLEKAGKITILKAGHGNNKSGNKLPKKVKPFIVGNRKIMVWHILTWHKELPYPNCKTSNAKTLLKKYPEYDCIVTGDNHKPFVVKHKNSIIVNVGSMMRNNADQQDYKPCVFLYNAKDNEVEKVYLPIKKGVVSREHIETKQKRDDRIDSFITSLNTDVGDSISFEENMEMFLSKNKIKKDVKKVINKFI